MRARNCDIPRSCCPLSHCVLRSAPTSLKTHGSRGIIWNLTKDDQGSRLAARSAWYQTLMSNTGDEQNVAAKRKQAILPVTSKRAKMSQTKNTKTIVAAANRSQESLPPINASTSRSQTFTLEFHPALKGQLLDWAYSLLETNMRPMYEDGWGWDGNSKLKELESPKARFIVVTFPSSRGCPESVGFIHYRFVADARRPVLYIFEIQIAAAAQGLGIGRQLMNAAELIAKQAGMACVMLTVFKHNPEALKFYSKLGYSLDQGKPNTEGACFKELSKTL